MNKDQVMKQIDDLVISQTFSLDALEGIKKIKDMLADTLSERDHYKEVSQTQLNSLNEKNLQINKCCTEINAAKATIANLEDELKKAEAAIWEKQIAEAKADAYQNAMAMVFKPSAVRETVHRTVAKPVNGSPGGNGQFASAGFLASGTESEMITREDV